MVISQRRLRLLILGAVLAAAGAALWLTVDDWRRDFVSHEAWMEPAALDPELRPWVTLHDAGTVSEALQAATRRLPAWKWVGESQAGATRRFVLERDVRLLPITDDVILRLEDLGDRRVLTGESRSRREFGDLGRNPRNLRRIRRELEAVLEATAGRTLDGAS